MTSIAYVVPSTTHSLLRNAVFWAALIVSAFNTLSALAGGIGILATDGLGMPITFLASGPFTSFTVPGLILIVVVGGTQAFATALLIARRESALLWTAVAGVGMLIWIFVETMLIQGGSWLQVLYFSTGIAQLALVVALLGVVSWLPRRPLKVAAAQTEESRATDGPGMRGEFRRPPS